MRIELFEYLQTHITGQMEEKERERDDDEGKIQRLRLMRSFR